MTSEVTIDKMREAFAAHGIPQTLASDNGPCFTSEEFAKFVKMNGVRHVRSTPYHPATNGLAERVMQTVKSALRKMSGPLHTRVSRFLVSYRTTSQSTSTQTPAEMLMNRKLRTRINTVVPNINTTVEHKQLSQKLAHDSRAIQEFEIGQYFSVPNYGSGDKWVPGYISKQTSSVSYPVEVSTGGMQQMWKRYAHQIRHRASTLSSKVISDVDFSAEVEEAPEYQGSDT